MGLTGLGRVGAKSHGAGTDRYGRRERRSLFCLVALFGLWFLSAGLFPIRIMADWQEGTQESENAVSDPAADLEDSVDWEATLEDVTLSGNYAADLLMVARSQLGYAESSANYIENADGTRNGYSRYGAWARNPYGNWCAMFVSFCLDYAEVPEDIFRRYDNCRDWMAELKEDGLWSESAPVPGDLVFFDWDGDGTADHVGIVAAVTEEGAVQAASVSDMESGSGTAESATESAAGIAEPGAESGSGTAESATESTAGTAEPGAESGSGTAESATESTAGTAEPGAESGSGTAESATESAAGTAESGIESGSGTAASATGTAVSGASGSAGLSSANEEAMAALLDHTIDSLLTGNTEHTQTTEATVLVTINGNYSDMVKMAAFNIEDIRILGYGSLSAAVEAQQEEETDAGQEAGAEPSTESGKSPAASGATGGAEPSTDSGTDSSKAPASARAEPSADIGEVSAATGLEESTDSSDPAALDEAEQQPTDSSAPIVLDETAPSADSDERDTEAEVLLAMDDSSVTARRAVLIIGALLILLAATAGIRILLMRRAREERLYQALSGRSLPETHRPEDE